MNTGAITSLTVVLYDEDELTATAECYAGMCDELAAMIEHSREGRTVTGQLITQKLAALHVELDELTTGRVTRTALVRLANKVNGVITHAAGQTGRVYEITTTRLAELHAALVDRVALTTLPVISGNGVPA